MRRYFTLLALCACLSGLAQGQSRRALILGIDTYQPPGTTAQHDPGCTYGRCELGNFENLEGAVNDAQAIADILTGPKFGFPADKVVLLTNPAARRSRPGVTVLPASDTTRDGILAAMQKYLVDLPSAGDTVVFYNASHGSLRVNTAGEKLTVRDEAGNLVHVDSTLVPSDAYKGGYDIRDREMTRIFTAALDKGVHLTIIFDSCHSGGSTRGLATGRQRSLPYDPRPVNDPPDVLPNGQRVTPPTERKDNPALVFAAVQQDQAAHEADPSDNMPESHGAFTAALIETLQILPANTPASVVYQRVKAVLEGSGVAGQEPDLDANLARRAQPLFGGAGGPAETDQLRTAVLKTDDDGSVWLDVGLVTGIGPGSEFTAITPAADGTRVKLQIDKALGIARSSATVLGAVNAKIRVGDVYQLSRLIPGQLATLKFWIGPATLSTAEIVTATEQIKASGVGLVADPAEEPYTDVLSWTGTGWSLRHATADAGRGRSHSFFSFERRKGGPVELGPQLTAAALRSHLQTDAKLWADLPASGELAAKLKVTDVNSEAQTTALAADANYVLAGSMGKSGGATYTWFHKSEFIAGPRLSVSQDHSAGCSATSPYPVRGDWVPMAEAPSTLTTYATRLAKVHGWLQLADSPVAGVSSENYFKLALVSLTDTKGVDVDRPLREADRYRLALKSEMEVKEPRWVYILDIDCHGSGNLVYPQNYAENQYPSEGDNDRQIVLRHAPVLKVGPPYGIDTMILLSTAQPLPDPTVLNFEGVARGVTRGATSPLQRLLSSASSGARGLQTQAEVPTNWGIQIQLLHSVPKETPR